MFGKQEMRKKNSRYNLLWEGNIFSLSSDTWSSKVEGKVSKQFSRRESENLKLEQAILVAQKRTGGYGYNKS